MPYFEAGERFVAEYEAFLQRAGRRATTGTRAAKLTPCPVRPDPARGDSRGLKPRTWHPAKVPINLPAPLKPPPVPTHVERPEGPVARPPAGAHLQLALAAVAAVLGLIVAQGVLRVPVPQELWHLIHEAPSLTEQSIMLIVLGLIDVVMISNLLVMVIVGGYETFVSRLNLAGTRTSRSG